MLGCLWRPISNVVKQSESFRFALELGMRIDIFRSHNGTGIRGNNKLQNIQRELASVDERAR